MLGNFAVEPILQSKSVLPTIAFVLFNLIVVIALLNVFVSILTDSYALTRGGNLNDKIKHESQIFECLKMKIKQMFKTKLEEQNSIDGDEIGIKYMDHFTHFSESTKKLINKIELLLDKK